MAEKEADQLQKIIEDAAQIPVWGGQALATDRGGILAAAKLSRFGQTTEDILTWIAMREADRDRLMSLHPGGWPKDRQYRTDSLPERISQAYADLLFGEDPTFTAGGADPSDAKPAADSGAGSASGSGSAPENPDQILLDEIIEENALPSELRRMASDCSAEGEQWWHVYTDPGESDYPIVQFSSRLDVVPLFRGRKVVAAGFIQTVYTQKMEIKSEVETVVYRRIEIQTDKLVRNFLYMGGINSLGNKVPLKNRDETANTLEEWGHGIEQMLAGRIPNKIGRDFRLGISDYQGIKDQLFDLNEARTIMAENARLSAKKRAVANRKMIRADGTIDLSSDVFITDDEDGVDAEMGKATTADFAILEYTFDAQALIEHIRELVGTAVTRAGLVEQFVNVGHGAMEGGAAASGSALRTRLIPTMLSASGKARYIDDELPKIMLALQRVDALDQSQGGCGHQWKDAETPPTIERGTVLPEDEGEGVTRHVAAVAGEVESRYTAIKDMHEDWTDEEVNNEIDRIDKDRAAGGGLPNFAATPNPPPGGGNGLGSLADVGA